MAMMRAVAGAVGMADAFVSETALCLEEAATNVVMHGLPQVSDPWFAVTVTATRNSIEMVIEDNGPEFDPTAYVPAEKAHDIADAALGGFGIMLMRGNSNDISYKRQGGHNVLTILCRETVETR